jgi:hypothetical protein
MPQDTDPSPDEDRPELREAVKAATVGLALLDEAIVRDLPAEGFGAVSAGSIVLRGDDVNQFLLYLWASTGPSCAKRCRR